MHRNFLFELENGTIVLVRSQPNKEGPIAVAFSAAFAYDELAFGTVIGACLMTAQIAGGIGMQL
jgi:hypothetical protein